MKFGMLTAGVVLGVMATVAGAAQDANLVCNIKVLPDKAPVCVVALRAPFEAGKPYDFANLGETVGVDQGYLIRIDMPTAAQLPLEVETLVKTP